MKTSNLHCVTQEGFTLIELLTVLTIAGILLGMGVPSFRSLMQSQKLTTTVNEFFVSISLTRSEAIKRGRRVDLAPKEAGGDWARGWVVFVDENDNQRPDDGELVIFAHDAVPAGLTVSTSLTDSKVQYLAYNGYGRTRTNASGMQTQFGTFAFRLDKQARKIKLNFLGRPRICNPEIEPGTC